MRVWPGIFGVILAVGLSGCAGYRLGPSNGDSAGTRTVQITPFTNRTLEPALGDALTTAVRKEIQREGTFQLATREAGDLIVSGEILRYDRNEISFVPTDVVTAQDYRVSFAAHVVARNRLTGKVVLDREMSGTTLMRVGNDLPSAERQTLPLLAADLARQITAALADGTW